MVKRVVDRHIETESRTRSGRSIVFQLFFSETQWTVASLESKWNPKSASSIITIHVGKMKKVKRTENKESTSSPSRKKRENLVKN